MAATAIFAASKIEEAPHKVSRIVKDFMKRQAILDKVRDVEISEANPVSLPSLRVLFVLLYACVLTTGIQSLCQKSHLL